MKRLKHYDYPDKFGQALGYKMKKMDDKKFIAELELKIREDHLSPAKRVHGGVISAFFDISCGAAVFTTLAPKDYCSTVELNDLLASKVSVVFRGKHLCVVHGFIYRNREKQPVAMATATFNIVTAK
jgi:acyl-coenzyme A thioesterase PaaI-like protein